MLADRKIPFSESYKEEWDILKEKCEGGIELMLEDSQRWFLATTEGDGIRISSAVKNVRPLKLPDPPLIEFDEFKTVAGVYNDAFFGGIGDLSARLEVNNTCLNMRYLFMMIYNLL
ncbi:MAG: hypothetical protein GTO02_09685 [Candidatus Dadabacteria bacterium]|nr:hypothetical protein [Candidatus Dadabacteria bacterium]NIQ14647.1 hypothetical protein [Candidatus Dadabacteria bacterium]